MLRRSVAALASSAVIGWISIVGAAEEPRTPIFLVTSADGVLSKQFVYHLREGLRASRGMSLSSDEQTLHQLRILAMEDGDDGFAYSVAWTYSNGKSLPTLVRHTVGVCGSGVIRSCADSVIASTDEQLAGESEAWSEALKGLNLSKFKEQQSEPEAPRN